MQSISSVQTDMFEKQRNGSFIKIPRHKNQREIELDAQ